MDYGLCCQRVTIYRSQDGKIQRQVAENCHLTPQTVQTVDALGRSKDKKFLLIIPGQADLQPGDRVYDGIGPEAVQWELFVPALVDRLYEISFVQPCRWNGEVCHVQAGHK